MAAETVEEATGNAIVAISRFTTGNHHYVYDVVLADGRNVVMRLTTPKERESMCGAFSWNHRLRTLGLHLPTIYFSDLANRFPFIIMERFLGRDLGFEIKEMSVHDLNVLAKQLMQFQAIVSRLPSQGRSGGYAAEPETAAHRTWSAVLSRSIDRSRVRIQASGFVDDSCFRKLDELFAACADELQKVKATPFLHDITTKNVIVAEGKLSGIVDVDDLCYGDPLFQVALTRMALLSDGSSTRYIDFLLEEYGGYSSDLLRLYTAECCVGFLSELGQSLNGNVIAATEKRRSHLNAVLSSL